MTDETDEQKARRLLDGLLGLAYRGALERVAEALKAEREARERAEGERTQLEELVGSVSAEADGWKLRLRAANDLLRRARNLIVCSQGHPEDAASPAWDCAYCGMRAAIAVHLKGGDPTEPVLSQSTGSVTQPGAEQGSGLSPHDTLAGTIASQLVNWPVEWWKLPNIHDLVRKSVADALQRAASTDSALRTAAEEVAGYDWGTSATEHYHYTRVAAMRKLREVLAAQPKREEHPDTARLDWLENNLAYLMVSGPPMSPLSNNGKGWINGELREAIDRAREVEHDA